MHYKSRQLLQKYQEGLNKIGEYPKLFEFIDNFSASKVDKLASIKPNYVLDCQPAEDFLITVDGKPVDYINDKFNLEFDENVIDIMGKDLIINHLTFGDFIAEKVLCNIDGGSSFINIINSFVEGNLFDA